MYFTDFCKSQRKNADNVPPYECRQDMEAIQSIPPSAIPTGVTDPDNENGKGKKIGDWASSFAQGLF